MIPFPVRKENFPEVRLTLIAVLFLVFAILIITRVPRGREAVWLGFSLFGFGCCFLGLIGLISRFGNYQLEGIFLRLPLNQPGWAWRVLAHLSLFDFMRFRLWSIVIFLVAQFGLAFSYTRERLKLSDWLIIVAAGLIILSLLWYYDPEHLFILYKKGTTLPIASHARVKWENHLHLLDRVAFGFIMAILFYVAWSILGLFFKAKLIQKRVQALCVGTGNLVLSGFFSALFCMGRGNVLNMHSMATTLLPVSNYPEFETTLLKALPFATIIVLVLVLVAILRYGFLGSWQPVTHGLDQQIKLANEAVRITLHSYKNRFLAVKMALDMAEISLREVKEDAAVRAVTQIKWASDLSQEALLQLDVLHNQAGRLNLNPDCFSWKELLEEALLRLAPRLKSVKLITNDEDARIWGDSQHLIAVLENLLQNAIDAVFEVKKEGYIPTVQVEIGREYEWSFIRIIDNGPGIDSKHLRKIFQPFYTTKPTKNNWGMGLAYCHRVVKAHRGFINIRSTIQEGATAEIALRSISK
jgi:signal transduction histidine kinase